VPQHMIEKADARRDVGLARTVEVEGECDVGLGGGALNNCGSQLAAGGWQ